MRSPSDYWEYLVAAQSHYFGAFVGDMQHLRLSDGWLGAMAAVLFLFVLEFVLPWRRQQHKLRSGLGTDLFYLVFNSLFMWGLFASALVALLTLLFKDALAAAGVTNLVAVRLDGMQMWARFLLMFLVGDLIGYFGHWMLHRLDFLWAFHKVHHSSKQLDVWNAQRFHVGEQIFWPIFNFLPFGLIGWPAGEVFAYGVLASLLSSFSHANAKVPLGPLKYIVNNPQLHIWHHAASVDPRRNVNYGDALCVWDYLFGTAYRPPEREGLRLGFEDIEEYPTTFRGQLMRPFVEIATSIRGRFLPG